MLDRNRTGTSLGCRALAAALPRIQPRLHCFGHIHEDFGVSKHPCGTYCINGASCTMTYKARHRPIVFDL